MGVCARGVLGCVREVVWLGCVPWVMGWGAGVRTRGNAGMLVAVGVTLLLLVFLVFEPWFFPVSWSVVWVSKLTAQAAFFSFLGPPCPFFPSLV